MKKSGLMIAASALSVALVAALPAYAQVSGPNGSDGQDESNANAPILVTGSRIARPESSGVIAGVQIVAQDIEARGFTNALEALNDTPLVGPGASPLNGNNGGQTASLGAAFPDLLDLGTQRTLTLVNGRRFVSGNAASLFVEGNATGAQVDANVIPSTLIERIDVLTVGGAAAYGADAISGVVNFILKDDFEGLTVRALSGITSRGDTAQYQLAATYGMNFWDGRGNVVVSGEYSRNDGLQADSRDFRIARTNSYTNPFNGGVRNPAFTSGIIDVTNLNNGAFLRNSDDGQASSLFGEGFLNQSLSFNGSVFNTQTTPTLAPYTPIVSGTTTTNFITLGNGLAPVGQRLAARTAGGLNTTIPTTNIGFFASTSQIIQGTPGAGYISSNGLNGRTTPISSVPLTTFAPTSLPATITALPSGVTAAQVFTQFGVTPPSGVTATAFTNAAISVLESNRVFTQFGVTPPSGVTPAQYNTLAVNVLQANRFTAREFYAANPNVNVNYFVGTFVPGVPRIANTDTTLVSVRTNQAGGTAMVPVNQVLPFVAVPLEFEANGNLRTYNFASGMTPQSPITVGQTIGSDGGFSGSLANVVLRTQQDRYIANLIGHIDLTDEVRFFTENTYARVNNTSLRNSPSQNFMSNTAENAPLLINVNTNPYLSAQNKAVLSSVGITGATAATSNFIVTRQNQDIFGNNPFLSQNETFRVLGGLRSEYELMGRRWNAEVSATYGKGVTRTKSTQINDIEYQLALDAVDQGRELTGTPNGNIVCRAKLFPAQYLGRSPIGTAANIVRQKNASGELVESLFTPVITQAMIDSCAPLNPFGYNNMSEASKNYVRQDQIFKNESEQILFTASFGGGLVDLPAGELAISVNGEYRKDKLRFTSNELNQFGRGRAAPSSNFGAFTETFEGGVEARIPVTGENFLSFLGELELNPAFRVTKSSGAADKYRNTAGVAISPESDGKAETIYSLAGSWKPVNDLRVRANYTKSVRQPSVVELFLGGQPVFTTPSDFCSTGALTAAAPAVRRPNCRAAVIAAGLATDPVTADAFLASFVPAGVGLSGTYAGNTGLKPEKATSWTVGSTLTPSMISGLSISADYVHLDLTGTIVPTGLGQGIQSCYDSPNYPDTTSETGTNLCKSFTRDSAFQIANGYSLSFLNLGSIRLRAVNISASYPIDLGDFGRISLRTNAYRLLKFESSASGNFAFDGVRSDGVFSRPKWEIQTSARYVKDGFYINGTWNYRMATNIFSQGAPAGPELFPQNRYPSLNIFDAAVGVDVNEDMRLQLSVTNITDVNYGGNLGYLYQDYYDQIGRRFQATVIAKF
jgi:outer membrane receptor protein involved in Fe transport